MKGKLKSLVILCSIVLFAVCMVCGEQVNIYAADTVIKPGATYAEATEVSLNKTYVCSNANTTIQYYKIKMNAPGVVKMDFKLEGNPSQVTSGVNAGALTSVTNAAYGYYAFFNVSELATTADVASLITDIGALAGDGGTYIGPVLNTTARETKMIGLDKGEYYFAIAKVACSTTTYKFTVETCSVSTDFETERNGDFSSADAITCGKEMQGTNSSPADEDIYTFTMKSNGMVDIQLSHGYSSSKANLYTIAIYDEKKSLLCTYASPGNETQTERYIGLEGTAQGKKYYVRIAGGYTDPDYYHLLINADGAKLSETELNNSFSTADTISVGTTVYGSNTSVSGATTALTNNSTVNSLSDGSLADSDYYVFDLPAQGMFSVSLNHVAKTLPSKLVEDMLYTISVYDTNQNLLYTIVSKYGDVNTKTAEIGVPAGKYYICISGKVIDTDQYHFSVKYTATNYCETESNNNFIEADPMELNQKYVGAIAGNSDYFVFTTPGTGVVNFTFTHDQIKENILSMAESPYTVKLYSSSEGDAFYTFYSSATETTKSSAKMGLPAGTYYAVVSGTGVDKGNYGIKINYTKKTYWECESNDTKDTANSIKVDKTYGGSLHSASDLDYYKFSVKKNGYIKLNFKQDVVKNYATSTCYKVYIYKSSDLTNELYCLKVRGDDTSITTPEIGVKKGTYYVKVTSVVYTNHDYRFKVISKASNSREKESNDTIKKANTITSGKTIIGSIRSQDDLDFYKFTMSANGYARINLKQSSTSEAGIYRMYLYDKAQNEIFYTVVRGSDNNLTTARLGLKKGTYYVLLKPYGRLSYTGNYKLTVTTKKCANYEIENNNTFGTANTIKVGGTIYGSTPKKSTGIYERKDYYKITVKNTTKIKVTMEHKKYSGSDIMWDVAIYDKDGERVTHNNDYIYSKRSTTKASTGTITLKKGTYYIEVNAHSAAANKEYKLSVKKA